MTEEIENKIEEFWSTLLCQSGFSENTAYRYKSIIKQYYKNNDDIDAQKIEVFVNEKSYVAKPDESRRVKRAMNLYYEWITSEAIPKKDTRGHKENTKRYRPRCKRECVHNHIGRCSYPDDEKAAYIIPTRCTFFEKEDGRWHEKKRVQVSDAGLEIVYRDSHSLMYGGRIDG